jgi:hypothetical protein
VISAAQVSLASRVEICPDVLCQDLDGEAVLLNLKTGIYLGLDAVGFRMWHLIEEHSDLGKVVAVLIGEYDVAADRCAEDLFALVVQMADQGLVRLAATNPP